MEKEFCERVDEPVETMEKLFKNSPSLLITKIAVPLPCSQDHTEQFLADF
jgi:hypothetical protein